ncbi:MAG: hypothetical protein ACK4SY_08765 [Pyrobaculum sp.]
MSTVNAFVSVPDDVWQKLRQLCGENVSKCVESYIMSRTEPLTEAPRAKGTRSHTITLNVEAVEKLRRLCVKGRLWLCLRQLIYDMVNIQAAQG